jgi:protein-serine/threonine kinase
MSVLSYLEDKIEHLELGSCETFVTPQINQLPTFDVSLSPELKSATNEEKEKEANNEDPSSNTNQEVDSDKQEAKQEPVEAETHKSESVAKPQLEHTNDIALKHENEGVKDLHPEAVQPNDSDETLTETQPDNKVIESTEKNIKSSSSKAKLARRQLTRDNDKENIEVREAKKKNRFSLLSFYNTGYPNGGSSASLMGDTSETDHKKILEPSNEANIANHKDKWASSSSSSSSKRSNKTTTTSTSTVNGREASAARKVMDFFKRRSVRIG